MEPASGCIASSSPAWLLCNVTTIVAQWRKSLLSGSKVVPEIGHPHGQWS